MLCVFCCRPGDAVISSAFRLSFPVVSIICGMIFISIAIDHLIALVCLFDIFCKSFSVEKIVVPLRGVSVRSSLLVLVSGID